MNNQADFHIGGWLIQPSRNRISRNGNDIALEHRVMRVLINLAQNAPNPVTREQLLEIAWPDLHTSEHSLTTVISELRKIFEDDPRRPHFIETIRKIGYRLMVMPHTTPVDKQEIRLPQKAPIRRRNFFGWAAMAVVGLLALGFLGNDFSPLSQPTHRQILPKPLTTYPGGEFDATISPDGQSMAFVWAGTDDNLNIYLKNLEGETPRRLTNKPGFEGSPVWSPDGKNVAYMGSHATEFGIFITSVIGGDTRRLTDCVAHDESALDWSPDGRTLVFSDRPNWREPSRLSLINLETGTINQLTHPSADLAGDRDPCFSPDGKQIAFVRGTIPSAAAPEISPFYGDLFIIDLATKTLAQITRENMELPGLAWTRNGDSLVFASNRDGGDYGLWQVDIGGGSPQPILRGNDLIRNPTFGSAGQLVYEDWQRDSNIWRLDLTQKTDDMIHPKAFIVSTRWESHPEYSPDGRQIAFASKRSGHTEIWVCDADSKNPRRITTFDGPNVNVPRWSPDGKRIAFEVRSQGQSQIFIQNLVLHQAPSPLTHGSGYKMAPSWSQDGRFLYFGSNENGSWQIWKIAATEGDPDLITPKGGFQAFEFGEYLYFSHLNRKGIWRQHLSGGKPELVIDRTAPQDWGNWAVRKQGIYFVRRMNVKTAALCFLPFTDGRERQLITFESHRVLGKNGLTVSPDGHWALFTKLDRLTGDLMLAEGFIQ